MDKTSETFNSRNPRLRALEFSEFGLMRAAIDQALLSLAQGGIPIGAVLARGTTLVGQGHNQRVQQGSAILHGEMDCLLRAGRQTSYTDTALFTTLSPCMMCSGTIVQFGIPRVVVGENVNFGGNEEFLREHGVEVIILNNRECINLMRGFIHEHPELWAEDIGVPDTGHIHRTDVW